MKKFFVVGIFLAGVGSWALADSFIYSRELKTSTFEFGKSKIVKEYDGRKVDDTGVPTYTLSIYLDGDLMAKYRNVDFEDLFSSEDHRFFVGLSNTGLPDTAFVVFNAQGDLIREQKHKFLPQDLYTERSVSVRRVWYDSKKPEVEFDIQKKLLKRVLVNGSNKQRFNLLKPDLDFRANPLRPGQR